MVVVLVLGFLFYNSTWVVLIMVSIAQSVSYTHLVNYLMEDVEKLKKEIAELKNKIA